MVIVNDIIWQHGKGKRFSAKGYNLHTGSPCCYQQSYCLPSSMCMKQPLEHEQHGDNIERYRGECLGWHRLDLLSQILRNVIKLLEY